MAKKSGVYNNLFAKKIDLVSDTTDDITEIQKSNQCCYCHQCACECQCNACVCQCKSEYNISDGKEALISPSDLFIKKTSTSFFPDINELQNKVQQLNISLEQDSANTELRSQRAVILTQLESYEKALEDYEWLAEHNPTDTKTLYSLGGLYTKLERYQDALTVYDALLKKDPHDVFALNGKAIALFKLERYTDASNIFAFVLKLDPANDYAKHFQGEIDSLLSVDLAPSS